MSIEKQEKPGWRTSEFYLNLAAMVIGAFMASGLFADGHIALQIAGIAMTALSALGYTGARKSVKLASAVERSSLGKPVAQRAKAKK